MVSTLLSKRSTACIATLLLIVTLLCGSYEITSFQSFLNEFTTSSSSSSSSIITSAINQTATRTHSRVEQGEQQQQKQQHQQDLVSRGGENNNDNKTLRLIHVINPYVVQHKESESPVMDLPIGFDQWVTLASIQRSLKHHENNNNNNNNNNKLNIDFVCAIFESDMVALSLLPCRKVVLKRSTQTEYPTLQPSRQLPFLQDILDASVEKYIRSDGNNNDDEEEEFYVMFTNADIGLTTSFYDNLLYTYLKEEPRREAFSINRVTIPMMDEKIMGETHHFLNNNNNNNNNNKNNDSTTSLVSSEDNEYWLNFVDERILSHGLSHPGLDCFVIHSSVLQRCHFGDLFLGFPPWGNKVHVILSIMADNYINIPSNEHGTFHLGNDKTWETTTTTTTATSSNQQMALNNNNNNNSTANTAAAMMTTTMMISQKDRFVKQQFCPGGVAGLQKSDYYTRNKVNCGYLFEPAVREGDRTVPAFVKPGYESIFLQNHHRIITYDQQTGQYRRLDIGKKPEKNQPISKRGD